METKQVQVQQGPRAIVIDASNVCWGAVGAVFDLNGGINRARPPLLGLTLCINYFLQNRLVSNKEGEGRIVDIVAVAPYWWQKETHMDTDDQRAFEQLVEHKKLVFADKAEHDDLVVLNLASKDQKGSYVVSNDKFRDHEANIGLNPQWYEEHRIGFTFLSEEDGKLVFMPHLGANLNCVHVDPKLNMDVDMLPMFFEPEMWALAEPHIGEQYYDEDMMQQEQGGDGEWLEDLIGLTNEQVNMLGLLIGAKGARIKGIEKAFACEIVIAESSKYVIFKSLSLNNLDLARMAFFDLEQQRPAVEPQRLNIAALDPVNLKPTTRKLSAVAKEFTPSYFTPPPVQEQPPMQEQSPEKEQPPMQEQPPIQEQSPEKEQPVVVVTPQPPQPQLTAPKSNGLNLAKPDSLGRKNRKPVG